MLLLLKMATASFQPTERCYFVEFLQRLQVAQVSVLLDGAKHIEFQGNSIVSDGEHDTAIAWEGLDLRPSTYSCCKVTDGGELHVRFSLAEGQNLVSHPPDMQIQLPDNTVLALRCRFCRSLLTDCSHQFKRVLPLPSDAWQELYADVFCHIDHSHDCTSQPSNVIQPREGDCLVGDDVLCMTLSSLRLDSIVVDSSKTMDKGKNEVMCRRCLSVLGTVLQGESHLLKEAVDVHTSCVKSLPISLRRSKLLVEEGGTAGSSSSPEWGYWNTLEDYFARRIHAVTTSTESFRFVLQSHLGSVHVWVLSVGNRVTFGAPAGQNDAFSGFYDRPELESCHIRASRNRPVIKLLYRLECTAERDVEVLQWDEEDWLNLQWVLSCRTRALPPTHRVANGFNVGFLCFLS